jgi:hypothetical protein
MDIRKEILDADDRTREEVDVSEYWPTVGKVWVSVMECGDRDSWECLVADAVTSKKHIRALLLVRCITDETGKRIFTDDDLSALSSKNWKALDHCYDVAVRLNKLSDDDLETIEKNSEGASGDASS